MKITIRTDFADIYRKLKALPQEVGDKALVRALNASIEQGKGMMARQISSEFKLSTQQVKDRLSVQRASSKRGDMRFEATLEATRRGKGRSMNIITFIDKSISLAAMRRRVKAGEGGSYNLNGATIQKALQLQFQIKRGGGKKQIKGMFIGNQGRTVFMRTGSGRLPIKAMNTIDVPQMFNTKRINSAVERALTERLRTNFERELRGILNGYIR